MQSALLSCMQKACDMARQKTRHEGSYQLTQLQALSPDELNQTSQPEYSAQDP